MPPGPLATLTSGITARTASRHPYLDRIISVAAALLIHAAILLSFMHSPTMVVRGIDGVQGMSVTLVGTASASADAPPPSPAQSFFEDLQQQESVDGFLPTAETPPKRQSLSDLFGEGESEPQSASTAGDQGKVTARSGLVGDPGAQISGGRRTAVLGPDGQILPCWRQAATRVPVKVTIILDHQGGMIGPPHLDRPRNARMDAARQQAETIAMRAMAGCAPYTLASVGGRYRSFELDFSKNRDWVKPAGMVDVY